MNETPRMNVPASKKRLLLAIYLDFVLFSGAWGLVVYFLAPGRPLTIAQWVVFSILEAILLVLVKWSPGEYLLSIRFWRPSSDPIQPEGVGQKGSALVDGRVWSREHVLTLALGVYLVVDGSKSLVRWTMWIPPQPLFGFRLSPESGAIWVVLEGIAYIVLGAWVLRLRPWAPWGVIGFSLLQLAAVVTGWDLWDAFAQEMVVRRRQYQGVPIRSGEIEFFQLLVPEGAIAILLAQVILVLVLRRRFEVFEAIRQILVERGVEGASVDLTPPAGGEQLANEIQERLARGPDPWGRARTRIVLLVLHIAVLVAAIALTPESYAFQLGASTGPVLLFSTLFLWLLLYSARTRKSVLVFCALAPAQAAFMAFVGLRFRAEEAAFQRIMAEVPQRRKEWETQMAQFRMDSLFEALSGKRLLRGGELIELQARARAGKTKAQELQSEVQRWFAHMESRVAAEVSPRAARNFRRGAESQRPESDKTMNLLQDYFSQIEQLTGFLIERQRLYRITGEGLVFDRDEDAQAYNERIETVARVEEQLVSARQKAEKLWREVPAPR